MSPDELMATHSERQIRIWGEKLLADYNRPSRSDFYLMQLASEVYRSWLADKTKPPDVNSFKLAFGEKDDTPAKPDQPKKPKAETVETITPEEMKIRRANATAMAMAKWFGIGGPPKGV